MEKICDYCLEEKAFYRCSHCKYAQYCSEECALQNWEDVHHEECDELYDALFGDGLYFIDAKFFVPGKDKIPKKEKFDEKTDNRLTTNKGVGVVLFWRIDRRLQFGLKFKNIKEKITPRPLIELHNQEFSNWFPHGATKVEFDKIIFPTLEHWMMWSKVNAFKEVTAEKEKNKVEKKKKQILDTKDPQEVKGLAGRKSGILFSDTLWVFIRPIIQLRGLLEKFGQTRGAQTFKRKLVGTNNLPMAEASPDDPNFGIKRAATIDEGENRFILEENTLDPQNWPGDEKVRTPKANKKIELKDVGTYKDATNLNILGIGLMAVRQWLQKGKTDFKKEKTELKDLQTAIEGFWNDKKENRTFPNMKKKFGFYDDDDDPEEKIEKLKSEIMKNYLQIRKQYKEKDLVNEKLES